MCQNEEFIISKEILNLPDINWHEKLLLAKIETYNKKEFDENDPETWWTESIAIKALINFLEEDENYTLSLMAHLESLGYVEVISLEEYFPQEWAKYGHVIKYQGPNNFLVIQYRINKGCPKECNMKKILKRIRKKGQI